MATNLPKTVKGWKDRAKWMMLAARRINSLSNARIVRGQLSDEVVVGDNATIIKLKKDNGVEFNGSVLLCINGTPYWIDIPYDSETGPYDGSGSANFPISAPD